MKICIDCDDAAVNLKKVLLDHLKSKGIDITDLNYIASKKGAMYHEIGLKLAKTIIDTWILSGFEGDGSTTKVEQMIILEKKSFHPKYRNND